MTSKPRIIRYGLVGPDTRGIKWYATAEEVAAVCHRGDFHHPKLRVLREGGEISFGLADEVAPVYAELARLRG